MAVNRWWRVTKKPRVSMFASCRDKKEHEETFMELLTGGYREEFIDDYGRDLIMYMLDRRRYNVADALFEAGMYDFTRRDYLGFTVLQYAIKHESLARRLVLAGVPLNSSLSNGSSVLGNSFYGCKLDTIMLMIAAGAVLTPKDQEDVYQIVAFVIFRHDVTRELLIVLMLVFSQNMAFSFDLWKPLNPNLVRFFREGPSLAQRCWYTLEIAKRKALLNIPK